MGKIFVTIKPNSKRNTLVNLSPFTLKIAAPAIEGRANEELFRFLSEILSVPISLISLMRGHNAPHKTLLVSGLTEDELQKRLATYLAEHPLV